MIPKTKNFVSEAVSGETDVWEVLKTFRTNEKNTKWETNYQTLYKKGRINFLETDTANVEYGMLKGHEQEKWKLRMLPKYSKMEKVLALV